MTKPKFFTAKFIENAIWFSVYFLLVAITPLFARPLAPLFDWVGYSQMRGFFTELFVLFFWGGEALLLWGVRAYLRKREILAPKPKKEKGEKASPMPLKNLLIVTGICAACVLLVSIVIGFRVKPFYDIGEKVTGHQLAHRGTAIARNIAKCGWMLAMLRRCKNMAIELYAAYLQGKNTWWIWVIAGAIFMLFGIFDIFTSVVQFPEYGFARVTELRQWLLALTYFLFYAAFPFVYVCAEERTGKSYLLILFIYLF